MAKPSRAASSPLKYAHHITEQLPRMDARVAEPFLPAQAGNQKRFQHSLEIYFRGEEKVGEKKTILAN